MMKIRLQISCWSRLVVVAGWSWLGVTGAVAGQTGTHILPETSLAVRYYGNDAPWFEQNIPFFECSDPALTRIYYYRWELYKSHLKDLGPRGYIVTEFLDNVSWALKPYQSLNDATAFHIEEGRWLKDNRYLNDYINFMYSGGNDRHFSEAIAAAAYARYLANGDRAFAIKNLAAMEHIYQLWSDHSVPSKGLYFIEPLLDATEYSIASIDASGGKDGFTGGDAFRPTINSFMFADAVAISKLATLAGDTNAAAAYAAKAEALRQTVETDLWNTNFDQFMDRYKVNNQYVHYWDFIRRRELAGYVPWSFELPDQDPKYNSAWTHLLSPKDFAGPYGLRTVEPSYQYYMKQYRYAWVDGKRKPECQWNGPSWPFDTTLVLEGMANLLNDYTQNVVSADDYVRLLKQYAQQHYLNGQPDLQEDYNPDTGQVIVGLPRSHHYNHSGFNNLIITGLAGLRPRPDNILEVNPLIATDPHSTNAIDYFCLENVPYHGQLVTILYDRDGRHYGRGTGLSVYVNGRRVVTPSALGRKTVTIPARPAASPPPDPIDLAVNMTGTGFPAASASTNNSARDLYQAVDGRVWFYSNVRNYWTDAGSQTAQDWFSLDFGGEKQFRSMRLYFYADGVKFKAPTKYTVQYWTGHDWADVSAAHKTPGKPLANGQNTITFRPVKTSKLRIVFTNPKQAAIALVEVKAYASEVSGQ
ncbi:MAG TPA: discoidin domain-containing protein [Verrucomicrobiae bacterium]|nr:discoidin domain-containing protein [Verrucomicrobiae bacterium]